MSIEYSYKDIEWCQGIFNKSNECFCDCNIIVPDSMDDVAKIISVKALPSVSDSKCENGKISLNGQVKITVLYIGENENGKIFSLSVNQSFSHTILSSDITSDFIPLITPISCNVNYSLVNSRRLKATAAIRFCASCYKNNRIKALSSVTGAEQVLSEKTFTSARCICTKSIIISDNVEVGAGKPPISSILKSTAKISDYEFKPLNNKIIVKGNLSLSVLYCAEDILTDSTITIPFTEVVEVEGVSQSCNTNLHLAIADCEVRPDTDLSGEYKMLDVNIVLSASVTAFTQENVCVVNDLYLPGGALNQTSTPISFQTSVNELSQDEFFKESLTLPPTAAPISRVVDIECRIADIALSDSIMSANIELTLLYLSSETSSINTYTAKLPVTRKFDLNSPQILLCDLKHIGYAITGDNSLELRLNIKFTFLDSKEEKINIISDCTEEKYIPPHRSSVIVSFVNSGDTLWSIAKKYNISLSKLASANAMDENAILTIGEKLIIPR